MKNNTNKVPQAKGMYYFALNVIRNIKVGELDSNEYGYSPYEEGDDFNNDENKIVDFLETDILTAEEYEEMEEYGLKATNPERIEYYIGLLEQFIDNNKRL